VVEESIVSAQHDEEEVHHVVVDSFESLGPGCVLG
jgi:hypothetical protein